MLFTSVAIFFRFCTRPPPPQVLLLALSIRHHIRAWRSCTTLCCGSVLPQDAVPQTGSTGDSSESGRLSQVVSLLEHLDTFVRGDGGTAAVKRERTCNVYGRRWRTALGMMRWSWSRLILIGALGRLGGKGDTTGRELLPLVQALPGHRPNCGRARLTGETAVSQPHHLINPRLVLP